MDSIQEVEEFIRDCAEILVSNGNLRVSFRDNSQEPEGHQKYIPVKSDENRILTCILALGKISAGLAHELNNPSAVVRSAQELKSDISTTKKGKLK